MNHTIVNNGVVVYGDVVIINTVLIKSKNVRKFSSNGASLSLENLELSNKAQLPMVTTPNDQLKLLKDEEFRQWFVEFSNGESIFTIYPRSDEKGGINFCFKIELHSRALPKAGQG